MEQPTQLTTEQIQKLFTFVRSKYVKEIDLQYELVDHLATGIETELSLNPNSTFERALQSEYDKFPITGFSEFKLAKTKALSNYWNKKIWNCIGTYLTLPKVMMTIFIYITAYQLCSYLPTIWICTIGFVLSIMSIKIFNKNFKLSFSEPYLFSSLMKSNVFGLTNIFSTNWFTILLMTSLNTYPPTTVFSNLPNNIALYLFISLLLTFQTIILFLLSNGEFKQLLLNEVNKKYQHLNIKLYDI